MTTYKVFVKWNKEKYDVELTTSEPPEVFKALLMSLTGVEPDRQKILLKGVQLKDSWDGFKGLKNGVTLMLMGSTAAVPQAPAEKTVFSEDLSEQQLAAHLKMPAGLVNLGNTCYMNATVQSLRSIPELNAALAEYQQTAGGLDSTTAITKGMKLLVSDLSKSSTAVTPLFFLNALFECFPRFSERGEQGGFAQQDANECWVEIVRCLKQGLYRTGKQRSVIDEFMKIEFQQTLKCIESEEEPPIEATDTAYQLSCFINKEVKYLHTGLQNFLKEHIEKNSPSLGRNAQYEKCSRISRLPAYAAIQYMRFEYKGKEGVNAKIVKDIKFPMTLDLYEFCTPALQTKLNAMRTAMKEEDDRQQESLAEAKTQGEALKKVKKTERKPFSFEDDDGSNNSGFYELQAIVTHKGRTSTSGHYIAWVKDEGDKWTVFDDDNVSPVTAEQILSLSTAGADGHTPYILLYGPKVLEVEIREEPMQQ